MFECKYCKHDFGRQSSLTIHQRDCAYKDELIGFKRCKKCNKLLPLTNFNKESRMYDNLNYDCKDCTRLYQTVWKRDIITPGILT